MAYDAFISYSHAADALRARRLHAALTSFGKPWWRRRSLAVFQDEAALAANPGLWTSLAAAMERCRWFVLLASPEAARSEWVAKEIAHWRATKPPGTLLPVLTSGEWVWDDAAGTFDWERSTAVPRALDGAFTEEPRYVDLRWATTEADLDLRDDRFRDAVIDLAAPIRGVPREDLEGEDVRQHRRTRRTVGAVGAVLLLLAGGLAAIWQVARHNDSVAQDQTRLAAVRQLVTRSRFELDRQLDRGVLAAVQATRLAATPEATSNEVAAAQRSAGLLRVFYDNPEVVQSTAISPDGKLLATGAADGAVRLYDVPGRRPLGELAHVERFVQDVQFSPDGTLLAAVSTDAVHLYDVASRKPVGDPIPDSVRGAGTDTQAHGVAFAPGGQLLIAYGGGNTVRYIDLASRRQVFQPNLVGQREVRAALLNSAFVLAAGSDDGTITILYPDNRPPRTLRGHEKGISALVALPKSPYLVSGSDDGTLRVWDVETGELVRGPLTGHDGEVTALATVGDGTMVASAGRDRTVRLWDVGAGRQLGPPLRGHTNWVSDVALAPDGTLAASGWDTTVRLWETADRRPLRDDVDVHDVAFAPDGTTLVTGDDDGRVRFWDVASGTVRRTLTGHREAVYATAFSKDGRLLATAGGDPAKKPAGDADVRLWDAASGALLATLPGHTETVRRLAFSPDGSTLLSGSDDGTVLAWDTATRRLRQPLRNAVPATVGGLAFLPDGRAVLGGPFLLVLDLARRDARLVGRETDYLAGVVGGIAVSPDGHTVAAGSLTGALTLWDPDTGAVRAGPVATDLGPVRHLAFTPDGRTLVTAGDRGALRFWDAATAEPLGDPVPVHDVRVDGLAFSPDGGRLATAGAERLIELSPSYLWDRDVARQSGRLCDAVGRNLTAAEWQDLLGALPYDRTCPQWPGPP